MRKKIIAGNWKLNLNIKESIELCTLLKRELNDVLGVGIVVCPVYTVLTDVYDVIQDTHIKLGAQDLYWQDSGAFTGEVSAPFLKDAGASYVIIGHSERRQFFGETNETVNNKIKAAIEHQLIPIVCVGESLAEREADQTFNVIKTQIEGSLKGFSADDLKNLILAYEPVWAIGTGKTASPEQAQEVHKFIRSLIADMFSEEFASKVCIQYGGSVKPDNAADLLGQQDIDGALVGGASLKADAFSQIVKSASTIAV